MEQRLSLVTLGTRDLARARKFYIDGLGWKQHAVSQDAISFFQLPGMAFALWDRASLAQDANLSDSDAAFAGISLAYNARSREDVDAVLAQAKAAGATILKPATETPWGGYSGYFADPDNHLWEVAHNPFWTVQADGSVKL